MKFHEYLVGVSGALLLVIMAIYAQEFQVIWSKLIFSDFRVSFEGIHPVVLKTIRFNTIGCGLIVIVFEIMLTLRKHLSKQIVLAVKTLGAVALVVSVFLLLKDCVSIYEWRALLGRMVVRYQNIAEMPIHGLPAFAAGQVWKFVILCWLVIVTTRLFKSNSNINTLI